MVKRALTLLTSLLFALPLLMPFNIYAQDTAVVVGTDVSLIDSTLLKSESYTESAGTVTKNQVLYTYKVTVQLDNNYVGYLLLSMNYSYYNNPQSGLRTDSGSLTRRIFINGDKAEFNFTINTWYSMDPLLRNTTNATPNVVIQDQGVTLLSELDSIQQIIDILNDLYSSNDQVEGLLNNQLQQLELIVSNTSLANQYLETISELRQYNFPYESFSAVYAMMKNHNDKIVDIFNYSYWQYPVFNLVANDLLYSPIVESNKSYIVIFYTEANINENNYSNYISYNSYFDMTYELVNRFYINGNRRVIKLIFTNKSSSSRYLELSTITNNYIIPFYTGYEENKNLSTEFALQFGLTNNLLDNLNLIANGTTASQSAADSSQSANEQLQTDSNTLFQQENSFKSDMNNAMQNVNNTFRLSDMGTKFVSSAQWVRTQYEQLTNSTPFSSLITFSLITGLALILLGKVYR